MNKIYNIKALTVDQNGVRFELADQKISVPLLTQVQRYFRKQHPNILKFSSWTMTE